MKDFSKPKMVNSRVLSPELLEEINGKIGKEEALNDFRKKSVLIKEDDLTPAIRLKLNLNTGVDGELTYDDTDIRNRLQVVENEKASKVELSQNYVKKTDKISQGQLDASLNNKLEEISLNKNSIVQLNNSKADKITLDNYRSKNVKITEGDLSDILLAKILLGGGSTGGGGDSTSLEEVNNHIQMLYHTKADLSALDALRSKSELIKEDDLEEALRDIINNASNVLDAVNGKVDVEELELYRKKEDSIGDMDLEFTLQQKIDQAYVWVLSAEAYITNALLNLKNVLTQDIAKASLDLIELYGPKESLVNDFKQEIGEDVGDDWDVMKALSFLYNNYRRSDEEIRESHLDSGVVEKLNAEYDDREVFGKINNLEISKVDKTELIYTLDEYRHIDDKIQESDLGDMLKSLIANEPLKERVSYLEEDVWKVKARMLDATIPAGGSHEINPSEYFGEIDARVLLIQVRVKDEDEESPTYGMMLNSEAIATVAVSPHRIMLYNNDKDSSRTFDILMRIVSM